MKQSKRCVSRSHYLKSVSNYYLHQLAGKRLSQSHHGLTTVMHTTTKERQMSQAQEVKCPYGDYYAVGKINTQGELYTFLRDGTPTVQVPVSTQESEPYSALKALLKNVKNHC